MQPSDAQPPKKEEKVGFWAKLFGKKPKTDAPAVPPHGNNTPPPQLGNDETAPVDPAAEKPAGDATVPGATPGVPDTSTQVPPATPPPATPPAEGGSDEQKPVV